MAAEAVGANAQLQSLMVAVLVFSWKEPYMNDTHP